jgi:hypothetical protein
MVGMRATVMYGAGDVRVENVPDSTIKLPTDALVRVTASCVCGSDLWPYASMAPGTGPARMGHEFIGAKTLRHPDAGSIELSYYSLDLPAAPEAGHLMTAYTAEPGSTAEEKLRLLASWTATAPIR